GRWNRSRHQVETGGLQVRLHAQFRHLSPDSRKQNDLVLLDSENRQSRELRFLYGLPAPPNKERASSRPSLPKHTRIIPVHEVDRFEHPARARVLAFSACESGVRLQ